MKVVLRENESLDDMIQRFKRQVSKAGVIQECKEREFYLKPGLKRKRKSELAAKRNKKKRK